MAERPPCSIMDRGAGADLPVTIYGLIAARLDALAAEEKSLLHDAAVIIQGDRILAASVVLPLTDNISASSQLGTRHRAAIGVTEESDALAVVVSEETGQMSVAHSGRLIRNLDQDRLRRVLRTLLRIDRTGPDTSPGGLIETAKRWIASHQSTVTTPRGERRRESKPTP